MAGAVQARFYVAVVSKNAAQVQQGWAQPAPAGDVTLRPVTRGEANSEWASATPSGEIKMMVRGEALTWFEDRLGKECKITFEDRPVEETEKS